jgi:hypothetical protein
MNLLEDGGAARTILKCIVLFGLGRASTLALLEKLVQKTDYELAYNRVQREVCGRAGVHRVN